MNGCCQRWDGETESIDADINFAIKWSAIQPDQRIKARKGWTLNLVTGPRRDFLALIVSLTLFYFHGNLGPRKRVRKIMLSGPKASTCFFLKQGVWGGHGRAEKTWFHPGKIEWGWYFIFKTKLSSKAYRGLKLFTRPGTFYVFILITYIEVAIHNLNLLSLHKQLK